MLFCSSVAEYHMLDYDFIHVPNSIWTSAKMLMENTQPTHKHAKMSNDKWRKGEIEFRKTQFRCTNLISLGFNLANGWLLFSAENFVFI